MLDEEIIQIIKDRRYLFRGTNTISVMSNTKDGQYCGYYSPHGPTALTSTTSGPTYAMINAVQRIRADFMGQVSFLFPDVKTAPLLFAINSHPYLKRLEKGDESSRFVCRNDDGLPDNNEYVISGLINMEHVRVISTFDELERYAIGVTKKGHRILKKWWFKDGFKKDGETPKEEEARDEKTLRKRLTDIIKSSFLYDPSDKIRVSFPHEFGALVEYCSMKYSEYDATDESVDIYGEDGEPRVTAFSADLGFNWFTDGYLNVDHAHRGKGFGRELVRIIEEIAKALEWKQINIMEEWGDVPFFEHLGYSTIDRSRDAFSHKKLD